MTNTLHCGVRSCVALMGVLCIGSALAETPVTAAPRPDFRHWKALRDAEVVRQERDFSCGLAALATMLTYYFGVEVSEAELLGRLDPRDTGVFTDSLSGTDTVTSARLNILKERGVSLAILADLASEYGLRAQGVRIGAETLSRLSMPAIAYIEPDGEPHFTLIRGVDKRGNVQVADPSWGNRLFPADDFVRIFALDGETDGRLLLVVPADGHAGRRGWFGVHRAGALIQPPL